jgi:hypothetical protein
VKAGLRALKVTVKGVPALAVAVVGFIKIDYRVGGILAGLVSWV